MHSNVSDGGHETHESCLQTYIIIINIIRHSNK